MKACPSLDFSGDSLLEDQVEFFCGGDRLDLCGNLSANHLDDVSLLLGEGATAR